MNTFFTRPIKKYDKCFYSTTPEFITYDSWVVTQTHKHTHKKGLTYCGQVTVTECTHGSEEHSEHLL